MRRGKSAIGHGSRGASTSREDRIRTVAADLFLSRGYGAVSVEMIVAKTGGSNRDIYNLFGGKEKLFRQVMVELCEDVLAPIRACAAADGDRRLELEDGLFAIANALLTTMLSPRGLALHRIVLGESAKFPALGKEFFRLGPASGAAAIAEFLVTRAPGDGLIFENPLEDASILIDMLTASLQLRALTAGGVRPEDVRARTVAALGLFLSGIRARSRRED